MQVGSGPFKLAEKSTDSRLKQQCDHSLWLVSAFPVNISFQSGILRTLQINIPSSTSCDPTRGAFRHFLAQYFKAWLHGEVDGYFSGLTNQEDYSSHQPLRASTFSAGTKSVYWPSPYITNYADVNTLILNCSQIAVSRCICHLQRDWRTCNLKTNSLNADMCSPKGQKQ